MTPFSQDDAVTPLNLDLYAGISEALDEALCLFKENGPNGAMHAIRIARDEQIRTHPIFSALHEDPANRCYTTAATARGRASLGSSTNTPAPKAVRNRAWLLANEIDPVCARTDGAEIFSLACGHLREARHSVELASRSAGRFLAMDQDVESLENCAPRCGPTRCRSG